MKYLKHSLLLLVLSGFLTGKISAIESSLPPCPGKGIFSGTSKWNNCYGVHAYSTGYKYAGEWMTGRKNGIGVYYKEGGSKYVGQWKDDQYHGEGKIISAEGFVIQEGVWNRNNFLYSKKLTNESGEEPKLVTKKVPKKVLLDDKKLLRAASGTGFAVTREGHLVTNNHVIYGCGDVKVHSGGKAIRAAVLSNDPMNDLAILKAEFKPASILPLSDDMPELMQDIFVAGFPFGQNVSSSVKVTKGIISSLTGLGNNFSNIQIDAAIQPGNSGGPIFDKKGNVVGVAVAKLDLKTIVKDYGVVPENTNFGIKANIVSNLLESNGVKTSAPNKREVSTSALGKTVIDSTYFLSCWMTMAQIEKVRSWKVVFEDLR